MFSFRLDYQNQLEHINKTIHESEKEVKRLETEQSQVSNAAPATSTSDKSQQPQVAPIPTFLNGFTLEKLDNNEVRRFVSIFHTEFDQISQKTNVLLFVG